MPFQVQDILLVSTLYDSFILEEDGRFSDKLFSEYMELHLGSVPRMTRASTGREALANLKKRQFDLVLIMSRVADMKPEEFARRVKKQAPETPIVMLAYDVASIAHQMADQPWENIDHTFIWTGDNRLLLALVKLVEDMRNVVHDTKIGEVRVVIVVEDSPVYYSAFLPMLYTEIMEQTQSLLEDSLNHVERIYRMRARPKILLAHTYEQASELLKQYRDHLLGLISDIRLPRNGKSDPKAGLSLTKRIRKTLPDLPLLLQSAESENRSKAEQIGISFLDKNSPDLLRELSEFIHNNFGFGEFVFRLPEGDEVARVGSLSDFKKALERVPVASLLFHAERNHFSNWLIARGEVALAMEFRPKSIDDFENSTTLRRWLAESVEGFLDQKQKGHITEFSRAADHLGRDFVRLGGGSMGGKGRGVAFMYSLLSHSDFHERYPKVHIVVPRTMVIGTNEFEAHLERHALLPQIAEAETDEEIARLFVDSELSDPLSDDLEAMLEEVRYPLAVRSSSLLEDSQFRPFAGVYATYMLPNNSPDLRVRRGQLRRTIKLVFASTYFSGARAYMKAIGKRVEEEKMAVLIQRLVGTNFGDRFYPTFSGVAQSYNYYPIGFMKPNDGIALVALGLGRTVVQGGKALRFSPAHPQVLPQMASPKEALRSTQRQFFAVDMTNPDVEISLAEEITLVQPDLSVAEEDGALVHVGATYSPSEDRIRDSIHRKGMRLVNFAPILKHNRFPVASILSDILKMTEEAMGVPLEMEFAVNLNVPKGVRPQFAVVQIRPLVTAERQKDANIADFAPEQLLLRSERALGHGIVGNIRDLVYIPKERFDPRHTVEIASEVATINDSLLAQHRPYVLIGPGRWGTADRFLGIPVSWAQVSAARIIVEIAMEGFDVDPSQGTHFFHNITALKVGYLSVDERRQNELIDWAWLAQQKRSRKMKYAVHLRLSAPIEAHIDGISGLGAILKGTA